MVCSSPLIYFSGMLLWREVSWHDKCIHWFWVHSKQKNNVFANWAKPRMTQVRGKKAFLWHEQLYKNKTIIFYLSLKWRLICRKPRMLAIECYRLKDTNWKSNWGLFSVRTHLQLFFCSSCTFLVSACWLSWLVEWWPWSSETRWAACL